MPGPGYQEPGAECRDANRVATTWRALPFGSEQASKTGYFGAFFFETASTANSSPLATQRTLFPETFSKGSPKLPTNSVCSGVRVKRPPTRSSRKEVRCMTAAALPVVHERTSNQTTSLAILAMACWALASIPRQHERRLRQRHGERMAQSVFHVGNVELLGGPEQGIRVCQLA